MNVAKEELDSGPEHRRHEGHEETPRGTLARTRCMKKSYGKFFVASWFNVVREDRGLA
jgi:hypothetical protein